MKAYGLMLGWTLSAAWILTIDVFVGNGIGAAKPMAIFGFLFTTIFYLFERKT